MPKPPTCYLASWCTCVMEQSLMTPAPAEQLHPCLILWHTGQPDLVPAPGLHLARPKWKGPTPAPCLALAPRKLNQNFMQDQVVKTVTAATQHPKRAVRPMKKTRPVLMAKSILHCYVAESGGHMRQKWCIYLSRIIILDVVLTV